MASHVLVPMDDSEPARAALEHACENHPGATITVLHVVDPTDLGPYTTMTGGSAEESEATVDRHGIDDRSTDRAERRAESVFEDAREIAESCDRPIETETVVGDVAASVETAARDRGVDLIVIGSHGRTGVTRLLLGSVAERVIRRAPVAVTVVR